MFIVYTQICKLVNYYYAYIYILTNDVPRESATPNKQMYVCKQTFKTLINWVSNI